MSLRPPLLFLTPVTPAEAGNGLAMRAGLLLEGLALGHEVHVLVAPVFGGAGDPGALVGRRAASFEVMALDPSPDPVAELKLRLATRAGRARALALEDRPALCRSATWAAAGQVAAAAEGRRAVVAMRLYLLPLLDAILDSPRRPPLVVDVDDLESEARIGIEGADHSEIARYARLQRHYLPLLDGVLTPAPSDVALLRAHGARQVEVVPNAVRIPPLDDIRAPESDRSPHTDLLFVGNLSYPPNIEAARWLSESVLPRLPEDRTLTLVGSRPASAVRRLESPRVRIAADVASVTPWYASSTLAVAPLRSGGGTSIKVIEALAHARPVVATRGGARGLDARLTECAAGDAPVRVADQVADFAAACRALLSQPQECTWLGRLGRAFVEESVAVELVAKRLDSTLTDILSRR